MKIKKADQVEAKRVTVEGAKDVTIRLLVHEADGAPNFYMRQFTIAPGGHTPLHQHAWEHEVYVLAGSAIVQTAEGHKRAAAGDCLLVPPNEPHQFRNDGTAELKFLCLVPKGSS